MPTFTRLAPGGAVNIVDWSTIGGVRPYDHLLIEATVVIDKALIKVKRVYSLTKDKMACYDDLKLEASD
ncbi:hypothetical protein Pmar_PMAR001632 [Perkinsus marinus ATCC 50983]|uniref:Uncharacterized protein n=1 Tax=Perkinsus marinus (strain ATCC 50983 / TXsc) TaxID=423536 RepID=C5K682_PERM5|nr:hypothetical protein Pmar_PMAR001632 [Perkinsus marinus ATCC 50983]EER20010.1 hypothetical protein Pmar_PMAR001632 [Perkinsus marinus ATCC 50983]|eukprot:XP_002788214.1 hypothetical protein Pmar_PMAR001632 [Perkinsus marinus ATCC 50983]